jgi:hypothetical protein
MRSLLVILLCCLLHPSARAEHDQLTTDQIRDGWISLFDGQTLFGWQQVNDVDWHVVDGEIRATQGEVGYLMTTSEFADYALYLEFKAKPDTNSGIFLRTPLQPKDPAQDCYELNIAPTDNPYPTGSLVKRHRAKVMAAGGTPKLRAIGESVTPWDGKWHSYGVRMIGNTISVQIDGREVSGLHTEDAVARGHIGLQHNSGEIAFRNVRLKPLRTKPLFNGKDLDGWNTNRAEVSEFKVTPAGELRVLNGRGQIESDASFGDFVLQLECFVDGDALNSGVFFRCIPGDFMMGYECQIQNGMQDGDPTKPVDCGTGGFFRRQNARSIIAKDREWFAMTLIADGPHMAAWVNGHQVSDWTDTRKPHDNPRKGLRLEPGTLAIQGHDPTTDLRFRNLKIVELPK